MAVEHEQWIIDLLDGIPPDERGVLHESLGRLKSAMVARLATATVAHP